MVSSGLGTQLRAKRRENGRRFERSGRKVLSSLGTGNAPAHWNLTKGFGIKDQHGSC